ncbi:MAG: serine hydrolase domain-containing protein [Allosphingosinicella sp.]
MTRRIVFLALAGLLLLGTIVWAATHVSVRTVGAGGGAEGDAKVGISDEDAATIEERQRDPDSVIDYARIDARLQKLMAQGNVVGLAVGIVEDGEIRFLKGYGETVAGSGEAVDINTVFRWASVSKGVAGDMVALLAHEGKLSLYEPVSRYSQTLRLPGGAEHKATVSDVLTHRLGLFGHAYDSKLEDGIEPALLRGQLATLNSICPPGQCHAYQNVAYDAAAEIVEKVTGKPYPQAVRERLFAPLGMHSASMTREALYAAPSWARPHVGGKNARPVEVTEPYYRVAAAGGVNSSIKDLAIWLQAQMGLEPAVLPREVLELVQAPRAATPGELGRKRKVRERVNSAAYGLGWRIYDYAGHEIVGHRGGLRGYRSLILFDPAKKTGVVAMWNSSTSKPGGLEYEVMDMLYGLPAQDWLEIDGLAEPEPEEDANASIDQGAGSGRR